MVVVRDWGEERKGELFNEYRVIVIHEEYVFEVCCTTECL